MSSSECAPLALFMLSLGGALSSFGCLVFAKIFKKKCNSTRFVEFCLLLSTSIVCLAWALFKSQNYLLLFPTWPVSDIIYFASLFVVGILCSKFWKIALPFFAVCYIALGMYTGFFLYSEFGTTDGVFTLKIFDREECEFVEKEFGHHSFKGGVNGKKVKFTAYTLPSKLVLPFPNNWYDVSVTWREDIEEIETIESTDEDLNFIKKWILSNKEYVLVDIPETKAFPAVYQFTIKKGETGYETFVDKTL